MLHSHALDLVNELIGNLQPGCDRISIAGSVRRGKPDPHDLELVAIPRVEAVFAANLFGEKSESRVDLFEEKLRDVFDDGVWELDHELKRNGPRYKRLRHVLTQMACDLFITTVRGWGGAMAIRTGPADFSQALVTLALRQRKHVADGYLIHGHPKKTETRVDPLTGVDVEIQLPCPKGADCPLIIPTPEERSFFETLGLSWIEPQDRTADWLWAQAKKKVVA